MTADSSHRPSNQPEFKPDLGETAVPTASEAAAAPPRAQPPSQAYWYLVCVLLLVIIGCLAYLWSSEHNSRVAGRMISRPSRTGTGNKMRPCRPS